MSKDEEKENGKIGEEEDLLNFDIEELDVSDLEEEAADSGGDSDIIELVDLVVEETAEGEGDEDILSLLGDEEESKDLTDVVEVSREEVSALEALEDEDLELTESEMDMDVSDISITEELSVGEETLELVNENGSDPDFDDSDLDQLIGEESDKLDELLTEDDLDAAGDVEGVVESEFAELLEDEPDDEDLGLEVSSDSGEAEIEKVDLVETGLEEASEIEALDLEEALEAEVREEQVDDGDLAEMLVEEPAPDLDLSEDLEAPEEGLAEDIALTEGIPLAEEEGSEEIEELFEEDAVADVEPAEPLGEEMADLSSTQEVFVEHEPVPIDPVAAPIVAPMGEHEADRTTGISEERLEEIVTRVVEETVERVARETLSQVAESMITEAIEALKKSLEADSD